jgi:phosphoglycerate dehydrogenase-like enzyme
LTSAGRTSRSAASNDIRARAALAVVPAGQPQTRLGRLAGRRALVIGASRGTGAAIVARLQAAGAEVLATARTGPRAADATTLEGIATIGPRPIGSESFRSISFPRYAWTASFSPP